ncbi:MAG: hypothetical protein Q4G34_04390 [Micrococcus sp.]|nr:hypothetical protein [Micrococcus sp.]
MRRSTRSLTGGLLAAALLLGGAGGAQAIIANTGFDGVMNGAQQSRYFQAQVRERTTNSNIEFTSIGGDRYAANVKAQNMLSGEQYTERKEIGRNTIASIENKTPIGHKTLLIVTNSKWTPVSVSIRGWFRTN